MKALTIKELYEWAVNHDAENFSLLIGDEYDASEVCINHVDNESEVVIIN